MTRDGGVVFKSERYGSLFFPAESKRMDSSRSFGEYYMQFYLRRHRAHMLPRCSRSLRVCMLLGFVPR